VYGRQAAVAQAIRLGFLGEFTLERLSA
jgi:hypothetical protein